MFSITKCQISYLIKLFFFCLFLLPILSCNHKTSDKEKSEKVQKELSFEYQVIDSGSVTNPWAKILADINSDGAMDIIIGGQKGPLVWYRNPGWDLFGISDGGYNTVDGEAGDIDGDGDMDIVMGGLFWYENPGTREVTQGDISQEGHTQQDPVQQDLTQQDSTQPAEAQRDATILGPAWKIHQISEHPTHDIELADLNSDNMLDVITRNQSDFGTLKGNSIHLWMNKGNGHWEEKVLVCDHGEGLNVADLDNDGDPDIIGTGFWFENSGGNWKQHHITEWHASSNLAVADFNGDDRLDIVLTPSELAGQHYKISWFEQSVNLKEDNWTEHSLVDSIECVIHGVATGDFNSDGAMDIAYSEMHQGEDPDEVVVLINQGNGQAWDKLVLSDKGSHSIEVADINGDGIPDILGANWSGDYQPVEVWFSNK